LNLEERPTSKKYVPGRPSVTGWNDWPFLLVKYRILSADEQNGNHILASFLQGSAPTGILAMTSDNYKITPTEVSALATHVAYNTARTGAAASLGLRTRYLRSSPPCHYIVRAHAFRAMR
jgi:hypothetical protein